MSQEFKIVISTPADPSGATATVFAAATDGPGAADALAQAAALTPDASLETLAASAQQAQANAEAARQTLAALANAPEDFLSKLETGFGTDFQGKIINGVEEIGQAFTEASQRGLESGGGTQEIAARPGASAGQGQPEPSPDVAPAHPSTEAAAARDDEPARPAPPAAGARGENNVADALERERGVRQGTSRHQHAGTGETGAHPPREHHVRARHAAPDHHDAGRAAARSPALPRAHARGRGGRETFTIHGYHGDGDPGDGLHTGGLSTGNLGDGGITQAAAALANPAAAGFGDAAAALAAAPSHVPSFPTAAASVAPAVAIQSPGVSLGAGASANDPFSAAADKFGDGAQDKLGKAGQTIDALSQKLGSLVDGFHAELKRLDDKVDTALSQNENRA